MTSRTLMGVSPLVYGGKVSSPSKMMLYIEKEDPVQPLIKAEQDLCCRGVLMFTKERERITNRSAESEQKRDWRMDYDDPAAAAKRTAEPTKRERCARLSVRKGSQTNISKSQSLQGKDCCAVRPFFFVLDERGTRECMMMINEPGTKLDIPGRVLPAT